MVDRGLSTVGGLLLRSFKAVDLRLVLSLDRIQARLSGVQRLHSVLPLDLRGGIAGPKPGGDALRRTAELLAVQGGGVVVDVGSPRVDELGGLVYLILEGSNAGLVIGLDLLVRGRSCGDMVGLDLLVDVGREDLQQDHF